MSRRVLIVSSQVRSVHSGVGTYADMLLSGLAETGSDTVRVTVATWHCEIDRQRHPDFDWISLGRRPKFDPSPGCFWTLGRRARRAFAKLGDAFDFDVVHFLDAREGHAFAGSRRSQGVEVIGTVHDDYAAQVRRSPFYYCGEAADPWRRWLFHRWQRRIEKRCYREFDTLMVNSRATADTIRREYGLDPRRLFDVRLTVARSAPGTDGESSGESTELEGMPSLVFSGGNFYRKGLDVLIKALPQILRDLPGARLHVAGRCRSAKQIRKLAERTGVAWAITFYDRLGTRRMAQMMASADMFVMPSRTEALGLVYLEAFRAGVPVVAGDRGGVTEIVHDRQSGVLVTPSCPAAVASAVILLACNTDLKERVVAGGRQVLAERTPDLLVSQTLDAYGIEFELADPIPDPISDWVPAATL